MISKAIGERLLDDDATCENAHRYSDSRYRILELQSSNRVNWLAYGVARHMFGDYESALHVCKQVMEQFPVRVTCWLAGDEMSGRAGGFRQS